MKRPGLIFFSSLVLLLSFNISNAQTNQFNIEAYKQFLNSNENLTTQQLLDMHSAGVFKGDLKLQPQNALYFDSISIKYNLTQYEKSLIEKNGFMVSERIINRSFGEAFGNIWHKDLPVFISTDAILHALHMSYDEILKSMEIETLIPKLDELLVKLQEQQPILDSKYSSNPSMKQKLYDVDVYLTVALKLFGKNPTPYYSNITNSEIINIMGYILNEKPVTDSLFSSSSRIMDYSQFKVRGHYTDINFPQLAIYFKTMMWLGRTEIYLLSPRALEPAPNSNDIQRQTIDALLLYEAIEEGNLTSLWNEIDGVIKFFVGESDNVTLPNLKSLVEAVNIQDASDLLDKTILKTFQDILKTKAFAFQRILSQIIMTGFNSPDSVIPASSFLLFGQRFIIDSYVTGSVVYDKIKYNGEKICRLFPSALDPMFALGNDAAAQLLQNELDVYHYSSNLAALRYLIDSYGKDYWNKTIYNLWLNLIMDLNPPKDRTNLPGFMQTAAFWQEKLNTQLASWSQLRHDNLLYAKQSYTGGTSCSYPYVYVEPFPEFFKSLHSLAVTALDKFGNLNLAPEHLKYNIINYFNDLAKITDTLTTVAQKELSSIPLLPEEISFLKRLIYQNEHGSGMPPYGGWYAKLFYNDPEGYDGLLKEDCIVADIHTVPTDCGGGKLGAVVHVGTGNLNLGVFIANTPDNETVAFIGPLLSYSEYNTTNFKRLTDQEWQDTYLASSMRPSWVNIYLADKDGNSKGEGLQLITKVEQNNTNEQIPKALLIAQNYPNPFNSTTIIRFSIPAKLSNRNVRLNIYDINGQLVKELLNENLPAGNYLTRWDGTNNNGITVSSGIYFYNLNVGGNQVSGKMSLIK